jgi:hypothetical protein
MNREMDTIFEAPGVPRGPDPDAPDEMIQLNRRTREEDPFSRTGLRSEETRRRLNDPEGFENRLNFNVSGTGPVEPSVGALPHRTDFEVPSSRMYDLDADPMGIVADLRKKTVTGPQDFNVMEQQIKEAGFLGYLEKKAPGQRGTQRAVVFEDALPELERVAGKVVGSIQPAPGTPRHLGSGVDEVFEEELRLIDERTPKLVPDEDVRAVREEADFVRQRAAGGRVEDTPFNAVDLTNEFGGSTVNPRNGRSLVGQDRWASSIGPKFEETFDRPLDHVDIEVFLRKHQKYIDENPDVMLGTWFDEKNQKWEVNLTKLFDQQREARNFAASNKQRAIMNLADPEFEAVATGDAFANARLRMRLDNEVPARELARLENFRANLDADELRIFDKMSRDVKQGALDNYSLMAETEDGAALALVGAEAARWYQESAKPITEMMGVDSPRFLAVTAAMSPNAPVDKAFYAGLDFWSEWEKAGRPATREFVEASLDRLKSKWGVTPTNANNLERILNMKDADFLKPGVMKRGGIFGVQPSGRGAGRKSVTGFLSGHKIDPFWGNLMQELQRYTMDTHMKSVTGLVSQPSATKRQVLGATAKAREYAKYLTDVTGQPWTAAEVQAAQWAVVKNMKEMLLEGKAVSKRAGATKRAPRLLRELTGIPEGLQWADNVPATEFGELSQRIRNSPSLARFLHSDEAAPLLRAIGKEPPPLSENLSKLDFLDDPQVRFGDVMEGMIRIAQTNGQSLGGVIAMLIGQGVLNQVQGAELLDALGSAAGIENVSEAAAADPKATADALMLLDEVPEADADTLRRLGQVRGRAGMEKIVDLLGGPDPETAAERASILQDQIQAVAGGGSFASSRVTDALDFLMPKAEGTQTAGIVFDLPFLRGRAFMDKQFVDDPNIIAHEGGHVFENLQEEESAGINAALDNFLAGLDPDAREGLSGQVVNRPATDEALRQELFANLFREEMLTPDAPPAIEGTGNVRQLFRQMIDRRTRFPGIGE